jgi:hypothetical protein
MNRAYLPFLFRPSPAIVALLGPDIDRVAVLAVRALLRNGRSLEVAHQQIRFRTHSFAFSSRIGAQGDLIVDMDVGDPKLEGRIVLEEDLARAVRRVRGISEEHQRSRRR